MDLQDMLPTPAVGTTGEPEHATDGVFDPFDAVAAQCWLAGRVLADSGYPLSEPFRVRGPGAYVLRTHAGHLGEDPLVEGVLYAGCSERDVASRLSPHRRSIAAHPTLTVDDVEVVTVSTGGAHLARCAEVLLIQAFDPLWCRPGKTGFGSRAQGQGRSRSRPTAYDRAHPGRAGRLQAPPGK